MFWTRRNVEECPEHWFEHTVDLHYQIFYECFRLCTNVVWYLLLFQPLDLLSCLFFFLASRDPELKNNKAVLISVWVSAINVSPEDLDDEMSGLDLQNTQMCRPWLGQKGYEWNMKDETEQLSGTNSFKEPNLETVRWRYNSRGFQSYLNCWSLKVSVFIFNWREHQYLGVQACSAETLL